ncbi:ABC transporter substrate-binding protein [Alkalibaculum sp. M08DMB]|uniref:ABC transporter substrate-binding protein n=2 Tax=Alkalibaculum sporogenes TaxID=2655001 RepID=A0A6A7K693_9FIRM|nr:ABC transporter substrate-binding protein [Alkalibaculum sporogenes]
MGAILILLISITSCAKLSGVNALKATESKEKSQEINSPIIVEGETYPLRVIDFLGKEIQLDKKPERVAVLSGTPLNIWYSLGGKSICTSNISENIKLISNYKDEIGSLPTVGAVYAVDMEAIIDQKPDLIISQYGPQTTQSEKLREMGFQVISTQTKTYEEVLSIYRAFGKILDAQEEAEEIIRKLEEQKNNIIKKLPQEEKTVVILYVTSNALSVKLDNSIAGDISKMLNLKNIASELPPDTIGSENTPLDIEYIVEKNPDYILVTSMIANNEVAIKTMEDQFKNNPVWKGVQGITEGRVIYLPQEYFLYNAGPYYGEAIEYMARAIYPEIYGNLGDWYGK